jgi:uncharacterized protein YecE (DUF72 family)
MRKLKDPEEPVQRLMERASGLGEKLGPVLLQFPHTWRLNLERLEGFMTALERYRGHRFAFEFRDRSWLCEDVYRLLERAGSALCLPIHPEMPLDLRLTAEWTYLRFHTGKHGIGFADEELQPRAGKLKSWRERGIDAFVYFNNDPEGHAIADAGRLIEMIS